MEPISAADPANYQLLAGAGWTSLPLLRRPALVLAGDDHPLIPWSTGTSCTGRSPGANSTSAAAGTWT